MMLNKQTMITAQEALIGRETPLSIQDTHFVNGSSLSAQPNEDEREILLGLGCFWGAERLFWQLDGVVSTSVGYSGGYTKNPTYEEVCSGKTGHTEIVRVIYKPSELSLASLLKVFWERHNPTQGMRQGNDLGTQYRSAIYVNCDEDYQIAIESKQAYQDLLSHEEMAITTEILPAGQYYFAEDYHQQYLAKNPEGYCGLGGTGVCFPPER